MHLQLALPQHDLPAADRAAATLHAEHTVAAARRMLAEAALTAGNFAHAEELIEPLVQDEEERAFVQARVKARQHDIPGALALVEPILRAHPDFVAALNLAGYLLADSHTRLPDAERYLRHARELSPGDPAILDSWGWLLLAEGKTREAVRALDQAARFAPLEPEILAHRDAAKRAARDTIKP